MQEKRPGHLNLIDILPGLKEQGVCWISKGIEVNQNHPILPRPGHIKHIVAEGELVFDLLPEEALDLLIHPDREEFLLLKPKPDISQQLYSTNKI